MTNNLVLVVLTEEYKMAWRQATEAKELLDQAKGAGRSSQDILDAQRWYNLCVQNFQSCRLALPLREVPPMEQPSPNHDDKIDILRQCVIGLSHSMNKLSPGFMNPWANDDVFVQVLPDTNEPSLDTDDTSTCTRRDAANFYGFRKSRENKGGQRVTFAKCCVTEHVSDHQDVVSHFLDQAV